MFNNVSNAKVRMSGEKMHQTDRNKMRADVIAEIMEVMHKNGVECGLVHDGIAVNIPHEDLGCINFVIDVKMKNADYDYDFEVEDYQKEQAIKAEKAKAQKEEKEAKIKKDIENFKKAIGNDFSWIEKAKKIGAK